MILSRVKKSLARHNLVSAGDRVLVALSGGPDSVALLDILLALVPELDIQVAAAHLDHGLRGAEGAEDARFVEELTRSRQVPLIHRALDCRAHARRRHGLSLEMAAREARYGFLLQAAAETGADLVATGHTADDLAETMLLFILRGTGDGGLRGFPWRRPLGPGVDLIRPLRELRRQEILGYLEKRGLPFRTDSSNSDLSIQRNRIRNELLPHLARRYNPQVERALCRVANRWTEAEDFLDEVVEESLRAALRRVEKRKIALDAAVVVRYHKYLRGRVLRAAYGLLSPRPLSELQTAALGHLVTGQEGAVDLPGSVRAALAGGLLMMEGSHDKGAGRAMGPPGEESAACAGARQAERVLPVPGVIPLDREGPGGATLLQTRLMDPSEAAVLMPVAREPRAVLDWSVLEPPLSVRHPRVGDRMRPLGMGGTKKLQDLLVDRKVPRGVRSGLWVVEDRKRILWVVGVEMSEDAKLTRQSRQALFLEQVTALEQVAW